ncbi:signal peptidase I [Pseudoflavonifractor sp. HCP28S3_F10]|uniref:signal peptidase I n=1 Tax=Pseudoflavonifractor sp. HCP28S3_F10 TaxID=3438947 RepID=UPI003F8BB0BF
MPKAIKVIWNAVTTLLVAAVVLLAVLLVGVRLVGLTPFVVLSGSMEPTYPTGGLIYVKSVPAEEIKVGDPITFVMNEDLLVATHRVVEIDSENQRFTTKGDANDAVDGSPVHFNNLIGRPVFCIPYLGYVSNFLTNPPGMYVGWSVIGVLLVLLFTPELLKWAEKSDRKAAGKKKAAGGDEPGGTP